MRCPPLKKVKHFFILVTFCSFQALIRKDILFKPNFRKQIKMANFSSLVNQCVIRPTYQNMKKAYDEYKTTTTAPCESGVVNQCAVRMSVALGRCGFSLDAFPNPWRVHRGRAACDCNFPHVLGAHELANYLRQLWRPDLEYRGRTLRNAYSELSGKRGIIYFNDVFVRANGSAGDHIDLWDGVNIYNQILKTDVGGGVGHHTQKMFRKANRIWFFKLY